ncbi:MAG: hypothetical protein QOG87_2647 [Actinomycetota bacterium]|jgi:hypothetical protein
MALTAAPSSERSLAAALAGLSLLVSAPYAVLGPNLLLDDWFTLWFRLRDGLLWTGGYEQLRARPGAWLVLLVEYGFIGAHPLAIYVLQAFLVAACVVLLFLAVRRFADRWVAAAVAGAWALMANHSTLDRWGAAMPALVSLLLLLLGVVLLERATDAGRQPVAAVAVLVASALTYEASLATATVAVVAIPWACRRSADLRAAVWGVAVLAATGLYMFVNSQHRGGKFTGWFDFGALVPAHFGDGLARPAALGVGLAMVGLFGTALALARPMVPSLRGLPSRATTMVSVGLAVIALGTLAFTRYPIAPLGLGDRANAVAGVGTALVWVGIGMLLPRRRAVLVVGGGAFGLILLTGHLQRDVDYARAGDDTVAVVRALERHPAPPGVVVVVGPTMPEHHRIVGLAGTMDPVIQVATGDFDRHAGVATDPTDFFATDPSRRLDVRPVLNRR